MVIWQYYQITRNLWLKSAICDRGHYSSKSFWKTAPNTAWCVLINHRLLTGESLVIQRKRDTLWSVSLLILLLNSTRKSSYQKALSGRFCHNRWNPDHPNLECATDRDWSPYPPGLLLVSLALYDTWGPFSDCYLLLARWAKCYWNFISIVLR